MSRDREYPEAPAGRFRRPPVEFADGEDRSITLRRADDGDREAVVAMYLDFDPGDRAQGIPPTAEDRIREWVADLFETGVDVVAVHDDRVVGHATLVADAGEEGAYELAVFVLGEYQGAGIGTELVRALLGAGQAAGVERVWLTVEPWNGAAISVYEDVGFERSGGGFEREYAIRLLGPDDER